MIVVYSTFPDLREAKRVARKLVDEGLAKCVNIFPSDSIYTWKGKVEEVREFVAIIKTKEKDYKLVEKRIKELHPYELPAIFSFKPKNVFKEFDEWIND